MRAMNVPFRKAGLLAILFFWTTTTIISAAEKIPGSLTIHDSLTAPNQAATIEATLTKTGLQPQAGLGGEPVELLIAGNLVAAATTGSDGRVLLSYTPKTKGTVPFTVRTGASSEVILTEAVGNLAVWERRSPIVVVEMAALMEDTIGQGPIPNEFVREAVDIRPMPNAAEELGKLTQFYYNVVYVMRLKNGTDDEGRANALARQWLKAQKFPVGHIVVLSPDPEVLGAKLDEMHAAGWKTLKTGVGRTKAFAEAFLQRRLEVVMVPEPAKGEAPRKAKVAKEWKDVRGKM